MEFSEVIQQIGKALEDRSTVKLNGIDVTPADPSHCIVRYERMPHGELTLKIEMKWIPGATGQAIPIEGPLQIE